MRVRRLPYHLGLIVPCAIILVNGAATYYSVIQYDPNVKRYYFIAAYAYVWLTYILAVLVGPGYTGPDVVESSEALYTECSKCHLPKPERAHHCRVCGRCVLRMDHHCPWTENCVGYGNLPHFMRFVGSAVLLNVYGLFRAGGFLSYALRHRRHLSYVIDSARPRVAAGIFAAVSDFVVALTLLVLWLRVFIDVFNGHTQIEAWEIERAGVLARRKLAPEVDFPFDVAPWTNIIVALGYPWDWVLPWSGPPSSISPPGHIYPKVYPTSERWPPTDPKAVMEHEYYRVDRWVSFDGDAITDYGVDEVDLVNDENIPLAELKKTK